MRRALAAPRCHRPDPCRRRRRTSRPRRRSPATTRSTTSTGTSPCWSSTPSPPNRAATPTATAAPAACSRTGSPSSRRATAPRASRRPGLLRDLAVPGLRPGRVRGWGGDPTTGYPYEQGVPVPRAPPTTASAPAACPTPATSASSSWSEPRRARPVRRAPAAGRCRRLHRELGARRRTCASPSAATASARSSRGCWWVKRLTAKSQLVSDGAPITEFNLKTSANGSQGKGGSCVGDSGGPVLPEGHRHPARRHLLRAQRQLQGRRVLLPRRPRRTRSPGSATPTPAPDAG